MNAYTITLKSPDSSLTVTTIEASTEKSALKKLAMRGLPTSGVVTIRSESISRVRLKPSSATVIPSNRMRTDILKEIQVNNYVSYAGVDYDKEAVDSILNARHKKAADSISPCHRDESQYFQVENRETKEFVDFIF